jgi:spermidine synthase
MDIFMAIIWQYSRDNRLYQVRSSGQCLRLYTNGVFHSQYHPQRPLAGCVWDLLALPALMRPLESIKSVLVLGAGAGAVLLKLNALIKPKIIIGIDWDPVHLRVARQVFKATASKNTELFCNNAVEWLKNYSGPPFDMIIEDLFVEDNGQPQRAVVADEAWCNALLKNFAADGVLVMNFDSLKNYKKCAFVDNIDYRNSFDSVYRLRVKNYDNCVAAFFKGEARKSILLENLTTLKNEIGADAVNRFNAVITKEASWFK